MAYVYAHAMIRHDELYLLNDAPSSSFYSKRLLYLNDMITFRFPTINTFGARDFLQTRAARVLFFFCQLLQEFNYTENL